MKFPKSEIIRSPKHRKFIATLPCVKCLSTPSVCAHLRTGTVCGTGMKPSDVYTVPLCDKCHKEQHRIGEKSFYGNTTVIKILASNIYACTGDSDEAAMWIMFARPLLFK